MSQQGAGGIDELKGSVQYCRVRVLEEERGWLWVGSAHASLSVDKAGGSLALFCLQPGSSSGEFPNLFSSPVMTRLQWPYDELGTNKASGQCDPAPIPAVLTLRVIPGCSFTAWGGAVIPCRCPLSKLCCLCQGDRPLREPALCLGQCERVISIMTRVSEWARGHCPCERHTAWGAPHGAAPFRPPACLPPCVS